MTGEFARRLAIMCLLTLLQVAGVLLVEASKAKTGTVPFHQPSAVLYSELLKLAIATAVWLYQLRSLDYSGLSGFKPCMGVLYGAPAILFTVQNNLWYFAVALVDPPTFQLWQCFKLIPAAVLARVVLGQKRALLSDESCMVDAQAECSLSLSRALDDRVLVARAPHRHHLGSNW